VEVCWWNQVRFASEANLFASKPIWSHQQTDQAVSYFSTIARTSRAERIKYSSPLYLISVPPYLE